MRFTLVPHPDTPPSDAELKVWASLDYAAKLGPVATANIWFGIGAPADRFVIPAGEPKRAEDLWQTTCFETFLRVEGDKGYREWNFAPSGQWAAYDFSGYRDGRCDAEVVEPYIRMEDNFTWWTLGATISLAAETPWQLGLSAILEEQGGAKSYWALVHSAGEPDFHDPGCFAARLA